MTAVTLNNVAGFDAIWKLCRLPRIQVNAQRRLWYTGPL